MKRRFYLIALCSFLLCACETTHKTEEDIPSVKEYSKTDAATYNMQLGLAYLKQGNRPRAKKKILTALSQNPDSPSVNGAMAYFLEKTGNLSEAKKYYIKAMRLAPGDGAQLNNYGAFLCRIGEYKEAETYFDKAVKDVKYANTAGAYENAGLCALEISEDSKAELYFKKALDNDPSRKVSLTELVYLYLNQKQYQKALNEIQKYSKISYKDERLLKLASSAANKSGNTQLASSYLTLLQKLDKYSEPTGAHYEYRRS